LHPNFYSKAECFRFGSISNVPKQTQWLTDVLPAFDEGRFKEAIRLNHDEFVTVLKMIEKSKVFFTNELQLPVSVQLAICLYRFGVYGPGASLQKVASTFGVGDGSTVTRVTRRVIEVKLSKS
jgi:hypothetical protein